MPSKVIIIIEISGTSEESPTTIEKYEIPDVGIDIALITLIRRLGQRKE